MNPDFRPAIRRALQTKCSFDFLVFHIPVDCGWRNSLSRAERTRAWLKKVRATAQSDFNALARRAVAQKVYGDGCYYKQVARHFEWLLAGTHSWVRDDAREAA